MAAHQPEGLGRQKGEMVAAWFGSGQGAGFSRQGRKQTRDSRIVEMVKKEVGKSSFHGWALFRPFENIGGHDGGEPVAPAEVSESGFRNDRLAVDKEDPGTVSSLWVGAQENRPEEGAIPGPEVGQGGRWACGKLFRKPACPESDLTE